MPRVYTVHHQVLYVARERFGASLDEDGIVCDPDREHRRAARADVLLLDWVEFRVYHVVMEQRELCVLPSLTRNSAASSVYASGATHESRFSGTPYVYCHWHLLGSSCRNGTSACASGELAENTGAAQYFWSGAWESAPSPSAYAFPFCLMIAVTRSGYRTAMQNAAGDYTYIYKQVSFGTAEPE
jgi:hypothetical protein